MDGHTGFIGTTRAFFEAPGIEQQIAHDVDGDETTLIGLSERDAVLLAGDGAVPLDPIQTTPDMDLAHRLLLSALRRRTDRFELEELLARFVGGLTEAAVPGRFTTRQHTTRESHLRLVDDVMEAIGADPAHVDFSQLALDLGYSRFHVTHVFSRVTGTTLSQHRNRVRIGWVLERLAEGERNVAALAADLGFADQSHMLRVLRRATGSTTMSLKQAMGVAPHRD